VTWATYDGHKYAVSNGTGSWWDIETEARGYGGHLVTINDAAENQWLLDEFGKVMYWIGFYQQSDAQEPDQGWGWISGEPVTYTQWRAGRPDIWADQPNEYLLGDDYAIMTNTYDGGPDPWGYWDDVPLEGWPQDNPLPGIMEVAPSQEPIPEPLTLAGLFGACCAAGAYVRRRRT
jgi:hypothetical protein